MKTIAARTARRAAIMGALVGVFTVALGSGTAVAAGTAERHLALDHAEPAVDGTVTEAPETIKLFFTQVPEEAGTSIRMLNAAEELVAMGEIRFDEEDRKIVMADVEGEMAHGAYKVVWRAMSADGHPVNGEFAFTYAAGSDTNARR